MKAPPQSTTFYTANTSDMKAITDDNLMEDLVNDIKAAESEVKIAAEKTTVEEPMNDLKNVVDKKQAEKVRIL